jgi:hypothetical protein
VSGRQRQRAGLVIAAVPLGCLLATQCGLPVAAASAAPSPTATAAPSATASVTSSPTPSAAPSPTASTTPPPTPTASAAPSTASAAPSPSVSPAPSRAGRPAPAGAGRHWLVTLTVQTVPALPGVRFALDGKTRTTDASGRVSYTEQHDFSQHTLSLADTAVSTRSLRYRFTRWAGQRDPDGAFRATVSGLPLRTSYTVTAAFTAQCPVRPRFTDQHGRLLDPRRISVVTVTSSAGRRVSVPPARTSWLDCTQPVLRNATLASRDIRYRVQSVIFAGTNIVYAGVERFSPRAGARPTIVGYFHDLTITVHDALFGGRPRGDAVVTLPSHAVRRLALGPGRSVTLDDLPQGDYKIDIRAAGSIISADTFRLSRTTTVDLTAVSAADLATVGGGLLLAALGLPLLAKTRRRRLLDRLRPGMQRRTKGSSA